MPVNIPENAARNADGSLQNPAAWGLTPQGTPMGASGAGGGFYQGQMPQVNFSAIDWNDPVLSGGDPNVARQSQQAFQNGQITSNLQTYLNERNTARNLGLIGANDEFNRSAIFGGTQPGASGNFFGQNVSQGPQVGQNALGNLGTVLGALGANSQSHMPRMDGGIPGIRQFGIPGTSNGIGGQAGLGATALQDIFRNYDLNSAIQMARGNIASNTGSFGANPATNPFGGGLNTNFANDRFGLNTAFNPYGAARPQSAPTGASPSGSPGTPSAAGGGVGNMPGDVSASPFAPGTGPGSARQLGNIERAGYDHFGNPLPPQTSTPPVTPVDPFVGGGRGSGGQGGNFGFGGPDMRGGGPGFGMPTNIFGGPAQQNPFGGFGGFGGGGGGGMDFLSNAISLLNSIGALSPLSGQNLMPRRQPGRGFQTRRPMNFLWGF